ncbi:MAG: hypothetical protein GC186_11335 [Rhodobacteraceae bacterium]|nr:hypothetical protein [Paracoccaceae bacterium]
MKPSFALNLSHEGIGLLHRTIRGWSVVGEVALDAHDLGGAMSYLRSTALGLEARGITTKLILPASQVLYTTVTAPGPSAAKRRVQIAAALEGQTPYAVADLVFDWCGTGSTVQVAVVARETLDEAEHFATEHRFNPVSFVAIPDNGQFAGEPFFGPAPSAATLLAGDKVERDQDPVRIVSRAAQVAPDDVAVPKGTEPEPAPSAAAPEPTEPVPDDVTTVEAEAPAAEVAVAETPTVELPPAVEPEPAAAAAPVVDPAPVPEPEPVLAPLTLRVGVTEPIVLDDEAPVVETAAPKAKREKPDAAATEDRPTPTFSTRRNAPALDLAEPQPDRVPPRIGVPPPRDMTPPPKAVPAPAPKSPAPAAPAVGVAAATAVRAATMPEAVRAALAAQSARGGNGRAARRPAPAPVKPVAKPPVKVKPGQDAELTRFLPRKPSVAEAPTPTGERGAIPLPPRPTTEAEAMTVFGERRKAKERRAPRYLGLVLTVILLALLGAVALWSTLYLSQATPPKPSATETAAVPAVTPPPAATATPEPQPTVTAAAPAPSVPDQPDTSADPQAVADIADKAMAVPDAASLGATDVTGAAAVAGPEVTLQAAPDVAPPSRPDAAGAIALASVDPRLTPTTIALLPGPGADSAPVIPAQPPVTPAALAATGNATTAAPEPTGPAAPTTLAAVAPQAPLAPAITAPAAETAPAVEAAPAGTGPVAEPPPGADPALSKVTPKPRPDAIAAAPAPAEPAATDAAPGDTGSALAPATATTLPKPRPTTGVFAPDITGIGSPAADLVSPLAVAASPRPLDRPKGLAPTVQASANTGVAAALAAAGPATAAQPAAKPAAPAADSEPEPVSAPMPGLPSNASVAKESTVNGAINLNRINLIGVFGTTSDRSALVRMPGGKVVRVQVGDTLDGGRIAAIGEDTLYYVKNGQNVQLKMPNG